MPKQITTESFIPLDEAEFPHTNHTLGTGVLTLNVPLHAETIMIQALTQNIRYTLNGTNPSGTSGFQLKASDPPRVHRIGKYTVLKFFRESSGAILELEYGGPEMLDIG